MIRKQIRDNIFIDNDYIDIDELDYIFGHEQAYDSFPCVFPSVRIKLIGTNGLYELGDKARGGYDPESYYDFFVWLNGYNRHHIETCLYIIDCDLKDYYVDLSEDEQEYIYQCINESYDCEQLLKNCADYCKEDIGELTILERRP